MSLARRQPRAGASASDSLALPKGPTMAQERAERTPALSGRQRARSLPHGSLEKPARGSTTKLRRQTAALRAFLVDLAKVAAKVRDHHRCLVPGCAVQGRHHVAAMHIIDAGMGGRFEVSNHQRFYVTGCHDHHNLCKRSIHSTHLKILALTADLGDGPCEWYGRDTLDAPWKLLGVSRPVPGFRA